MEELKPVAREALDAFDSIAASARNGLADRGISLDSFASMNEATAERLADGLRELNAAKTSNLMRLKDEPAIARLVYEDEEGLSQTLYISPAGSPSSSTVRVCSYMSPMGRMATSSVGEEIDVRLPRGEAWFLIREKMTFKPLEDRAGWDSQPAIHFREGAGPLTIRSLRDLLRESGATEEEVDALARWLEEGDAESGDGNLLEGIQRDALTAMQLRIAPILDRLQDRIFRLPLDSQIAVMGPPGTGKTTTMVRRLRQKLDFEYLEDDEKRLVEEPDAAGLAHADSWILFTPTELLRLYVKEALGKEGVPAHDERLQTWDDYRYGIARNVLGILRRGNGGGLVLARDASDDWLKPETLRDQAAWFRAFNDWQASEFIRELSIEAERLSKAEDSAAARIGERVAEAVRRSSGDVIRLLAELAGMRKELTELAANLGGRTRGALAQPLRAFAAEDPEFLDALARMVTNLLQDAGGEAEDSDEEDDEGDGDDVLDGSEAQPVLHGRRLVADVFRRAMRSLALRQASSSKPLPGSRAGRILAFLHERRLEVPDLRDVGKVLLLQRAAGRLGGAPANYLRRIPARYRRFRRAMRAEGAWYGETTGRAHQVHPAEVDVIILTMLRASERMGGDRLLSSRLRERRPALLDAIAALRRNQVLVDEATDFSPIQLASMAALASPRTRSLFLSGDFNQRLTRWGARSLEELKWVAPALQSEHISVTYRQSRKLAAFSRALARLQGAEVDDKAPDFAENVGFDPIYGAGLADDRARAVWLSERIREIERVSGGQLPTIAVLVPNREGVDSLASALNEELSELSLQAKAYTEGEAIGKTNDVRVFPVEHIKGLEFEAVFFLDVDHLAEVEPELFDRYIYVGSTRAATFLGLTSSGPTLPPTLAHADLVYEQSW